MMVSPVSFLRTMNVEEQMTESLFSYGTLQTEGVQRTIFGRSVESREDALVGYRVTMVKVEDENFVVKSGAADHRNLQHTGLASDVVKGAVLAVTKKELEQADSYEPWDYKRVQVKLRSGTDAWIYLKPVQ
jgi:gamma-glutamylcyclotransferase (GGCT)/AIG2-like uncharacterized protein YtfP